jgi:predicted N-acetyltransferase YhbS
MTACRIELLADCPQHVACVAAWQQAEFGYLAPTTTLEQREARLRAALQGGGLPLTVVAVSGAGVPVGAATLQAQTITHPHLTPWLSTVVVPPAWRGQGIASALSLRIASEAARLGFPTIYLFTPHNASLYRRLGWQPVDVAELRGTRVTIMARPTDG